MDKELKHLGGEGDREQLGKRKDTGGVGWAEPTIIREEEDAKRELGQRPRRNYPGLPCFAGNTASHAK